MTPLFRRYIPADLERSVRDQLWNRRLVVLDGDTFHATNPPHLRRGRPVAVSCVDMLEFDVCTQCIPYYLAEGDGILEDLVEGRVVLDEGLTLAYIRSKKGRIEKALEDLGYGRGRRSVLLEQSRRHLQDAEGRVQESETALFEELIDVALTVRAFEKEFSSSGSARLFSLLREGRGELLLPREQVPSVGRRLNRRDRELLAVLKAEHRKRLVSEGSFSSSARRTLLVVARGGTSDQRRTGLRQAITSSCPVGGLLIERYGIGDGAMVLPHAAEPLLEDLAAVLGTSRFLSRFQPVVPLEHSTIILDDDDDQAVIDTAVRLHQDGLELAGALELGRAL